MSVAVRVVMFGTYDTSTHPRVGILAEGLRRHGAEVAECNAPLGIDTAGRVEILRRPWLVASLAARILGCWWRLVVDARALPRPDVVLVGYLGHFDVLLARLLFRRTTIVLDHLVFAADTARDRGETGGVRQALLRALDRAALSCADVIVVDTEEHRGLVPERRRHRAVVVPVGVGEEWFAAARLPGGPRHDVGAVIAAGERRAEPLRVVFFGVFTPLQGAPVIGTAIGLLASEPIEVTMIGHGQDLARTRAAAAGDPRVRWLDWVAPAELPGLVAEHDVCLGIFGTGPKALRVVPNKVFQGAAAGCAVVTSDTAPQRRAFGDAVVYVPAGSAIALATALRRLRRDPEKVAALRAAAGRVAREHFAPEEVVRPLLDRLVAPAPTTDRVPRTSSAPASLAPSVPPPSVLPPSVLPPLSPNAWLRWDVVAGMLPADAESVLEVGCGQGGFGARLAQRYDYLGLEPAPESCAVARARLAGAGGRGEIRNGDLSVLWGGEVFDLVCAFEVIEHIEHDEKALAEWAGRVRPGGWLLLSAPAFQHRYGPGDAVVGHFRRYEPDGLARMLREAGLEQVEVRRYGGPLGYVLEGARNQISRQRQRQAGSMAERTKGSGRFLQPRSPLHGAVTEYATLPFRLLQRGFPGHGPGLVARARRPE
ncbi:Glycosyltransferase involved in cell wall bisynthesis [Actinopolymorpha singaporensis]|uniref:Glycosyltransferase involved in cell wall bisynthesis n=1 Tax=Actinopolymorpha singaporensis TaxID=117157 RepID=A0A1H1T5Y8_9ACTN|nr:Glycosyltransferase involved in cell wall bisynthesis [Actinopolymorpha singaporensis]